MIVAPTLTTERLRLRNWRSDDLQPFSALNADSRVMAYFPKCLTRSESDQLAAGIQARLTERGFGLWAAEIQETGEFIGFVGLSVPSFQTHFTPCVEIGWRLAFEAWGQGYATEAADAALKHAYGVLGLTEVVAFTAVFNARSRRVMERLGMSRSPDDDFDHPVIPAGHPIRRHVLYRLPRSSPAAVRFLPGHPG